MNLHAIASSVISAVNPNIAVQVEFNDAYATSSFGKRVPAYSAPVTMTAQVQSLSTSDLRQLQGLNITSATRSIWLSGSLDAVSRVKQTGGDRVTLPDGKYLVTMVLERWPEWCRCALTLQNGS